ncbi:MAG: hypothetical protein Q8S73_28455 [Deltaproteobacteria bacterium]|nr:hypothetical protein [Deltaproteobacteria bacterium]
MTCFGPLVRVGLLVGSAAGSAYAQQTPPGLTVRIDSPTAGIVDAPETVRLRAAVSGASVSTAQLDFNGVAYEVPVERGVVEQVLLPFPGNNRVVLSVRDGSITARASTTFFHRLQTRIPLPPPQVLVVASWASRETGFDLLVSERRAGASDGDGLPGLRYGVWPRSRDRDRAFGMEGFAIPQIRAGRFVVQVEMPSGYGALDEGSAWDGAIGDLDAVDRSLATAPPEDRAALLDRRRRAIVDLDRQAQPSTRQTRVHVDVVLFANTPWERRWRFDRVVQRLGGSAVVGEFEVTEAMIRAAAEAEGGR